MLWYEIILCLPKSRKHKTNKFIPKLNAPIGVKQRKNHSDRVAFALKRLTPRLIEGLWMTARLQRLCDVGTKFWMVHQKKYVTFIW